MGSDLASSEAVQRLRQSRRLRFSAIAYQGQDFFEASIFGRGLIRRPQIK